MINQDSPLWRRREEKLARLPLMKYVTLQEAATFMGIKRESLRANYITNCRFTMPEWIEQIRDEGKQARLVLLRRTK